MQIDANMCSVMFMMPSSAKLFELDMSPPPFLYLLMNGSGFQENLQKGVSFASGGAGLLDITNYNNVRPLVIA